MHEANEASRKLAESTVSFLSGTIFLYVVRCLLSVSHPRVNVSSPVLGRSTVRLRETRPCTPAPLHDTHLLLFGALGAFAEIQSLRGVERGLGGLLGREFRRRREGLLPLK